MPEDADLIPTATAALQAARDGRLAISDLVERCLMRVHDRDLVVRAFVAHDPDAVRAAARRVDALPFGARGLLGGIPVAFKDIIDTADLPTCHGSPIHAGRRPNTDAAVVALARAADAVVFGKTVTTEFANRTPGPTTNPHRATHTPGGSSSGSAAAVAAGMVPLALGTQTSGSVIRPAAFCGVHGFKGSWGEISYAGVKLTSSTLDTIGLYARSVADISLLRAVMTMTPPVSLVVSNAAAPRIALCRTPFRDQADAATHAVLDAVARATEHAGGTVEDFALPAHFAALLDAHRWISSFEGARSLAWEKTFHRDRISAQLLEGRVRDGEACSVDRYRAACRLAERCRTEMDLLFGDFDAVLTPAAPGEAPEGLLETGSATFNTLWTVLHTPCITVPGHTGATGLPLGFQLVGRRGTDERLLETAAWVERAAFR